MGAWRRRKVYGMERRFIDCNPDLCTGCQICELACSSEKKAEFNPDLSRIRSIRSGQLKAVSVACRFCEDTPCISACPRDALRIDEQANVIRLDKMRCSGCGRCIEACDFGAIVMDRSTKSVVICDLCEGRSQPKCVEFCPKKALKISTLQIKAQQATRNQAEGLTLH